LRFLVDAQRPPALAEALRRSGHEAVHVADLDLTTALDRQIWELAIARSAVLVTKDRDFAELRMGSSLGPMVLWIRTGNVDNRTLIAGLLRTLPAISSAVERGEKIIEFVRG
jgi:predicted nuclease of predicted toxin-antitoxin system